jgi:hypothetical protein
LLDLWQSLLERHPILAASAAVNVVLLAVSVFGLWFDHRLVTGANPWLKPMKFELSILIFLATVAWLLEVVTLPVFASRTISAVTGGAMIVEIVAIVIQAARGVPSHYNVSSTLNALIFTSMALAIVCNTVAMAGLLIGALSSRPNLPPAVIWGIRLGLILFLLGSLQGFQMVANRGHTVGAPDGGLGWPMLRWSRTFGDLRIAHFVGLHGLQLLPLLGWVVSWTSREAGVMAVWVAFVAMALTFAGVLRQAMAGIPLLR